LGGKAAFNCRLWADARSAADPLVRIQSLGPRRGKHFCFPLFSFFRSREQDITTDEENCDEFV